MSDLLDVHQMRHRLDHSAHLGPIVAQRLIADPAQSQCSERVPLILLATHGAAHLTDLELRHYELTACLARRIAAGVTSSTVLPRRLATSSGCSSPCSAATVACTTLIAFAEPRDLANTSCTPAHSSTARADPPAITPVPGEAGRSRTTPAAFSPCTGCGIVPWIRGTAKKCFFASLGDRRGHLLGLAVSDAHSSVAVSDDHQRGEAEPPAALDDLGHPVDGHHPLDVVALLLRLATTTIVTAATLPTGTASAALGYRHRSSFRISFVRSRCLQPRTDRRAFIKNLVVYSSKNRGRPRARRQPAPRSDRGTCDLRG